jgi:hypothetical protein
MKRDLIQWGHGSIDDEKVADDMARLSDGAVQLDLNSLRLLQVTEEGPMHINPNAKRKKGKR